MATDDTAVVHAKPVDIRAKFSHLASSISNFDDTDSLKCSKRQNVDSKTSSAPGYAKFSPMKNVFSPSKKLPASPQKTESPVKPSRLDRSMYNFCCIVKFF